MEEKISAETVHFGEHLTIDGYGGDLAKLGDKKNVFDVVNELPDLLKMKKLSTPAVFFAPENGEKDPGGWRGFVVVAESHIALHTFPARGFVSADIYTCRNGLQVDFVVDYFKEKFKLQDVEINLLRRGTKYPVKNIY
ncbi:MAG: S-adenosylmethionine decarboxylase [Candidatus Moranbacteria bacterium]|nr:S-adenosylmethionine decarboxylase [Candidatus Moranbacteria bacterium]MDZ4385063.1 S-adenosylmethionine decarboxylase [Candidatus Moranbacteria bacterium]